MSDSSASPNPRPVREQAIEWLVILRDDELDEATLQAFSQWLDQDPSHAEAFSAAELLFRDMVTATGIEIKDSHNEEPIADNLINLERPQRAPIHQPSKLMKPWLLSALGMAAIWLLAVNLVLPSQTNLFTDFFSDYHTQTGELRTVQLSDGSQVLLNTTTAISVDFTMTTRTIHLHHGQAQFTVAQDAQRPFVVLSNGLYTQALGTVFDVNHPDKVETSVLVQEHAVSTRLTDNQNSSDSVTIQAGQMLRHHQGQSLQQPESVNLSQATAWQQHQLVINDRPLSELIQELERHQTGRIFINDAALKQLRVTGVFSLDNTQETLQIVCAALNLRHTKIGPWWTVLHR